MKKIILSVMIVAILGVLYADNESAGTKEDAATTIQAISLSGIVIDYNSGEALTGVEITLEGTWIKIYTDFDGKFEIENIKPGNYNIIAAYISYDKSLIENYKVDIENNEVNIKLHCLK
ncbi:MAG: carboxypeptidase-like regulatory domain-containing protein [Bacteroidetes bacterium]|nr:MAG: carboxypeptidase-like regulatory domain-containing protein [Bacteroidota bacterium]